MRIAIVTDTNSGISVDEGKQLGITVLPMPVIIEDDSFLEGVDITHADLYEAMNQKKNISTSQPAPSTIMDTWDELLNNGFDEIVHIPMSSGLSNSFQSAFQFALDYDGKVQVVDNHRISVTLRSSIFDAILLAKKGLSAKEIKEQLEKHALDASIYITVNSLEYLKKGGRITPSAAAFATVMNIKPVLTIQGDKLDSFAKVRGQKQSEKKMIAAIKNDLENRFNHIPMEQLSIATAGTFENPEDAENWRLTVQEAFPDFKNVYYSPLSCSIACHVGIHAVAMGIIRTEPGNEM